MLKLNLMPLLNRKQRKRLPHKLLRWKSKKLTPLLWSNRRLLVKLIKKFSRSKELRTNSSSSKPRRPKLNSKLSLNKTRLWPPSKTWRLRNLQSNSWKPKRIQSSNKKLQLNRNWRRRDNQSSWSRRLLNSSSKEKLKRRRSSRASSSKRRLRSSSLRSKTRRLLPKSKPPRKNLE